MDRSWRVLSIVAALALVGGSALPVAAQEGSIEGSVEGAASGEAPAPASDTTRPTLPHDLPARKTPDEPQFVGPATLRLSGKTGSYAWHEVLVGAQEVEARVVLTPAGASCAARVRLIEDGDALVNEWFSADPGEKTKHESVLVADYLAGKLRVDSDCQEWSLRLTPLDDPDLELTIEETYYPVRGDSIDELAEQTAHIKGKWAAFTEWYTSWIYWTEESDGSDGEASSCAVTGGETDVRVSITYPQWNPPKGVDPALVREWGRFMEALRVHEQGHVTIAAQGADAIDDRLDAGFTSETCDDAREAADEAADRIFERYSKGSKRYDKETDHGLTQGTGLG